MSQEKNIKGEALLQTWGAKVSGWVWIITETRRAEQEGVVLNKRITQQIIRIRTLEIQIVNCRQITFE